MTKHTPSPGYRADRRKFLGSTGALLCAPLLPLLTARPANATAVDGSTWTARGGTQAIGAARRFADPFIGDPATACRLTCGMTIGPCHTLSPQRFDISDGWQGLPLRLALRVLDSDCKPVPDAIVEIWHTNHTGGYSGRIAAMCNNDADDIPRNFFRGYQRTNAEGRVDFATCYPGWYRGRAVHIHLRIMTGAYEADDRTAASVTTQLLFPDALNDAIFSEHPDYRRFGKPDTRLDSDGVVGAESDKTPYLFEFERLDDGVLFAHKTLVIRRSNDETLCEAKGMRPAGGPRGRGGPPPDGFRGPPPPGIGDALSRPPGAD